MKKFLIIMILFVPFYGVKAKRPDSPSHKDFRGGGDDQPSGRYIVEKKIRPQRALTSAEKGEQGWYYTESAQVRPQRSIERRKKTFTEYSIEE